MHEGTEEQGYPHTHACVLIQAIDGYIGCPMWCYSSMYTMAESQNRHMAWHAAGHEGLTLCARLIFPHFVL